MTWVKIEYVTMFLFSFFVLFCFAFFTVQTTRWVNFVSIKKSAKDQNNNKKTSCIISEKNLMRG